MSTPKRPRISAAITRRVWAAVTRDPQASYRVLTARVGVASTYTVQRAMIRLRDAGYIEFAHGRERARRVLVPFVEARK